MKTFFKPYCTLKNHSLLSKFNGNLHVKEPYGRMSTSIELYGMKLNFWRRQNTSWIIHGNVGLSLRNILGRDISMMHLNNTRTSVPACYHSAGTEACSTGYAPAKRKAFWVGQASLPAKGQRAQRPAPPAQRPTLLIGFNYGRSFGEAGVSACLRTRF